MHPHNKVIWHEGMLLQPQHFQQYDRYMINYIEQKHTIFSHNTWGFRQLTLDGDALSVGKLGIRSASGIFPDGTCFNMPKHDLLPTPYTVPEGMSQQTLYLALPIEQAGMPSVASNTQDSSHYRYRPFSESVSDHIAGSHLDTEIQLATLQCKILSAEDDLSPYTVLPITQVVESRANHHITLNDAFMTTWLDIHQCPLLGHFVSEVHDLLSHRAEMLASRLNDTQQAGTAEFTDLMLLQLVNQYEPLFHYLMHKHPLHPEPLFTDLLQLLGELSTYSTDKRRPIDPPIYQHDQLLSCFEPLMNAIRHALSMVLQQHATAIALESRGHGLWVGQIHDKDLLKQGNFVLAVYADIPIDTIRAHFATQIKIAPVEQIHTLVSKALPGIAINPIAIAPRQIPYHANFAYFSLMNHNPLWQLLEKSAGIALHVGSPMPGLKMELWGIKA